MTSLTCRECTYFRQHYGLDGKKIFRVYCGHCTQVRKATRKPDRAACDNFVPAHKENTFVTKEYLSKELLRYILEMELLPDILDMVTTDGQRD